MSLSIYVLASLPHTMCIAEYLVLYLDTAFLLNFVTSSVILKALNVLIWFSILFKWLQYRSCTPIGRSVVHGNGEIILRIWELEVILFDFVDGNDNNA